MYQAKPSSITQNEGFHLRENEYFPSQTKPINMAKIFLERVSFTSAEELLNYQPLKTPGRGGNNSWRNTSKCVNVFPEEDVSLLRGQSMIKYLGK